MLNLDKVLAPIRAMNDEGVEYITFGAIALWAHGIVRATEGADFFIAPTSENVERLRRALRSGTSEGLGRCGGPATGVFAAGGVMPVWKYRSIAEMPEAWTVRRDIPLGRRIRAVLSMAPIAGPLCIPRGVKKFRSIEELAADRHRYEHERIERIRAKNAQNK